MNPKSMIINRPELQSRGRKLGYGIVTLVFWLIWIYLWLPLITLLAWYAGIDIFHTQMVELEGFEGLISELGSYFTILELIIVVFLGWSLYNQRRFGQKGNRRRMPEDGGRRDVPRTSYRQMCRTFGLAREGLARLRKAKIARVDYLPGTATLILETRREDEVMGAPRDASEAVTGSGREFPPARRLA